MSRFRLRRMVLLLASQIGVATFISLHGEPKSGTTWMEMIGYTLAEQLCARPVNAPCTFKPAAKNDQTRAWTLTRRPSEAKLQWITDPLDALQSEWTGKHEIPGLCAIGADCRLREGKGVEAALHAALHEGKKNLTCHHNGAESTMPCGLPLSATVENIAYCLPLECPLPTHDGDLDYVKYLVIFRDPRDVIVSAFHYFDTGKQTISQYAKANFGPMTAWIAARFIWHDQKLKENSYVVYYEELLHEDAPYYLLAGALGLKASPADISAIRGATSADVMREMEKKKALPGRNAPGKDTAKVRAAGEVTFMASGISEATIAWMNRTMVAMLPAPLLQRYGLSRPDAKAAVSIEAGDGEQRR